jgi:hypothetical protein
MAAGDLQKGITTSSNSNKNRAPLVHLGEIVELSGPVDEDGWAPIEVLGHGLKYAFVGNREYWCKPSLQATHQPNISVSTDSRTATDVAGDPITGDVAGGARYRSLFANRIFKTGKHVWTIRVEHMGRVEIGVCQTDVPPNARGLHANPAAWVICITSAGTSTNSWHNNQRKPTGLPNVSTGNSTHTRSIVSSAPKLLSAFRLWSVVKLLCI